MRYFEKMRLDWLMKRKAPFNRKHLMDKFDISVPQASKDIQKLLAMQPGQWKYNRSKRQYERQEHPKIKTRL